MKRQLQQHAGNGRRHHIRHRHSQHRADAKLRQVAAAIGVSTRYLHRVFEAAENSVSASIRARRLQRAHEDLTDRRLRQRSIAEIASRNGFANQSSFATCFKKEFGVSPRTVRATVRSD